MAKGDGFGISEDSLRHLIDSFRTIAEIFDDILKEQRTFKPADAAPPGGGAAAAGVTPQPAGSAVETGS